MSRADRAIAALHKLLGPGVYSGTLTADGLDAVVLNAATVERLISLASGRGPHARYTVGRRFFDTSNDEVVTVTHPGIDAAGQVRMQRPDGTTCWLTVKPGRFRPVR